VLDPLNRKIKVLECWQRMQRRVCRKTPLPQIIRFLQNKVQTSKPSGSTQNAWDTVHGPQNYFPLIQSEILQVSARKRAEHFLVISSSSEGTGEPGDMRAVMPQPWHEYVFVVWRMSTASEAIAAALAHPLDARAQEERRSAWLTWRSTRTRTSSGKVLIISLCVMV
jgi:hypothetical protein